jgi:hypothetical protein
VDLESGCKHNNPFCGLEDSPSVVKSLKQDNVETDARFTSLVIPSIPKHTALGT